MVPAICFTLGPTNVDDPTTDPKFGRVGRQKIEDTSPLTRKRMETFDAAAFGYRQLVRSKALSQRSRLRESLDGSHGEDDTGFGRIWLQRAGVLAHKLWAPTAAGPFPAAHLKSLEEFPPRQGADTLSMKKDIDEAMKKLDNPGASSN